MRLCLSQGLPTDTEYLTLSHCWGQNHFTTLTQSFHSFLCEIPTDLLTKTFKDAIAITRKLGFRYIWIDSLCIFQGDLSGWQAESALMANVYGNSTLNIAAADAPDGDTGCFFERTSFKLKGWKISAYTEKNASGGTFWDCMDRSLYFSLHQDSVLAKRGWVFQERVLPPRVLYFGSRQISWECREGSACETFPRVADVGHVRESWRATPRLIPGGPFVNENI
jgi:hypothetical protein